MTIDNRKKIVVVILWVGALAVSAFLVQRRYHATLAGIIGVDFTNLFDAARQIAAGHSPYDVRLFVYAPPLALFLRPFAHVAPAHVWKAWTVAELVAFIVGVAAFVAEQAQRLRSWQLPILFAFCTVTLFHFWPVAIHLFLGQSDAFVFATLLLSGLMFSRARPVARGSLIGIAGLLKAWPAALGLALFQRRLERREQAFIAFALTTVVAPILMLGLAGGSGVTGFVRNNLDVRKQSNLVSDSVWGVPKLLFSHSGLARPLVVSSGLRVVVTAVLLAWVIGLLVTAIRTPGDASLCLWNVMLCVVLLLPFSHMTYTLYALPILWIWASRVFGRAPRFDYREVAVVGVLVVWWLVEHKSWPDTGSSAAISSVRFCVVFATNLVACTVSVIAAKTLNRLNGTEVDEKDEREIDLTAPVARRQSSSFQQTSQAFIEGRPRVSPRSSGR